MGAGKESPQSAWKANACSRSSGLAGSKPHPERKNGNPDRYVDKSPANEKGDPLGSPSPRCSCRASPPPARATRPGGRRRPALPQGRPCSTIGAGRLNFRVRYGSGCAPAAVAAGPRGALRRGQLRAGGAPGRPGGRTALGEVTLLRTVGGGGDVICVPKGSAD